MARAQSEASLTLGSGTVRFPDGSRLGLFSVAPAFQMLGPYRQLTAGLMTANLSEGGWYGQGQFGIWAATHPLVARWQLAADLDLSGTAVQGQPSTGAGQLTIEALWGAARWGFAAGAGGGSGWITRASAVTAQHARLRAWWQTPSGRLAVAGAIQPTRFLAAWFTDIDGGVTAHNERLEVRLWASGRVSRTYGSKLAALAAFSWRFSSLVSLEASGGSVLPDPYQGFPRSGFVTAGLRVHLPARIHEPRLGFHSDRFAVVRQAGGVIIRFRQPGARHVDVIGDWNGWEPTPLAPSGDDTWHVTLPLGPGTYHFSLLVNGTPWTAPEGVPTVPDGMGGRVAVLIVL
jgi:hypothetical protein